MGKVKEKTASLGLGAEDKDADAAEITYWPGSEYATS
jgi:hypothetical protein